MCPFKGYLSCRCARVPLSDQTKVKHRPDAFKFRSDQRAEKRKEARIHYNLFLYFSHYYILDHWHFTSSFALVLHEIGRKDACERGWDDWDPS